jgi:hypothetical protein
MELEQKFSRKKNRNCNRTWKSISTGTRTETGRELKKEIEHAELRKET